MAKGNMECKIVQLDVGGTLYKVSRGTLERCEGSMLASLISNHWKEGNSDDNEPIFIDRNGRLFEYVLDYLRMNEVYLPCSVSRTAIKKEFEYYGIGADMNKVIEKHGFEYYKSIKEKADAFDLEMRAIRISALAECELWKSSSIRSSFILQISLDDYMALCKNEDLLRERLLDRGLQFVSITCKRHSPYITVKVASK